VTTSSSLSLRPRRWSWVLVAAGIVYAVHSGLLNESPVRFLDSQWIYVSGVTFARGESPYDLNTFERVWRAHLPNPPLNCPFAYFPTILCPAAALSRLPWSIARYVIDAINVCMLTIVVGLAVSLADAGDCKRSDHDSDYPARSVLLAGLGCFVSGVPAVLLLGQTTFFGIAGAMGAVLSTRGRRPGWMAFSLLLCTFKPQIALLPLTYLLFSGHARFVLRSLWLTILCGAVALIVLSRRNLIRDFADSIRGYQAYSSNRPPQVSGIASLFGGFHGPLADSLTWTFVGVVATAVSARWIVRTRCPVLGAAAITLTYALTGAFVQLHPYDYALYLPVIALATALRGRMPAILWTMALLMVARAPNVLSLLQGLGAPATWTPAMMCTITALPVVMLAAWRVHGLASCGREVRTPIDE
jgi:hypothetical protein